MRRHFDEQIESLNRGMIEMGALVEQTIEDACDALRTADLDKARMVMNGDHRVDHKEREIETLCLHLLLQQQPVARDLRLISAAMKMITDMERIGDQAADISEIVTMMDLSKPRPDHFRPMAKDAINMVHRAIDAFVNRDTALAEEVIAADDTVDEAFLRVKTELVAMLNDHPGLSQEVLDLLMIAKYFERIADHAVNIAEWVVYAVTGFYKGEELQ